LGEQGLIVSSQVLYEQVETVATYLEKTVFLGITDKIKAASFNEADDTFWKNLDSLKKKSKSSYFLWGVRNPAATLFSVYDSRSQRVASNFLADLKGVLLSDGHHSFKTLASDQLTLAHDWCHVRRKYKVAEKTFPAESVFMLEKIKLLFAIEEQLKGQPPDKILEVRQALSKPITDDIRLFLDGQHALPGSSLGKAHRYTDKLWQGLTVFLKNPAVPIHTNGIEGALRQPAVGRRNHFGSKNLETAKVAAIWYSVIETCKQHNVPTREYLTATLQAILRKDPIFMPWEWTKDSD
jgi:transposase